VTRHPHPRRIAAQPYPGPDWRAYRLTVHFRLGEFFEAGASQPPAATMRMVRGFCSRILEPLRERYGACVVVSGHRTPARNAAVGGARWSWHVWEWHPGQMGVDVVFSRGQPSTWGRAAERGRAGGIGIYSGHLHLDSRPGRVVWSSAAR
jgi:hypothetical protein